MKKFIIFILLTVFLASIYGKQTSELKWTNSIGDVTYWSEQPIYDIPIGESYTLGPSDAKVTLIEWIDFQ